MQTATAQRLSDGRLHLQHGPIDLIIEAWGADVVLAYEQAEARFQTILVRLAEELLILRAPLSDTLPVGPVARRMARAVAPHRDVFVTPMAAVAGAVADEICMAMCMGRNLDRAYVNNGGDIAVYLAKGNSLSAAVFEAGDAGRVLLKSDATPRGIATSGWGGRSHSLGIADAVTVVAENAAMADVAATLIANAVDLTGHPAIERCPAVDLAPDSDLGERLVTTAVNQLAFLDINNALERGAAVAEEMRARGLIAEAVLYLQGEVRQVAGPSEEIEGERHVRIQTA